MGYSRICLAVALQRYVDFTPIALRARALTLALAKANKASIDVISVNAPVALLPGAETTEEKLERFLKPLLEMDLETAGHVLKGVPADVIQSFVVGAGSDLLIIGSHSKRGPLDIGMGSTSAAVTKSSPCSVLMVWPTKEEAERVKKLMIPAYPFVFPYG